MRNVTRSKGNSRDDYSISRWKQWAFELGMKDLTRLFMGGRGAASLDDVRNWTATTTLKKGGVASVLRDIVFADLQRFQYIDPSKHVAFRHMLERLYSHAVGRAGSRPLYTNTWGDGLHLIYNSPAAAAGFSLAFVEAACLVDWKALGLSLDTNFRVGIHRGYVHMHKDKIGGKKLFVGANITHAARIEPAAIPGQVLTSKAFAESMNESKNDCFECVFVGDRYLAKSEKKFAAYQAIRRKDSIPVPATR
jgi:class 3 adenylate cyclase